MTTAARTRRYTLGLPALALALAALGCTDPRLSEPPQTESARQPFLMRVEDVIVEAGVPQGDTFIDRQRAEKLSEAAQAFLDNRLRTSPNYQGSNKLRATVEQARMSTRPLETSGGIAGVFRREADQVIAGDLAVRVAIEDATGRELVGTRVEVERSRPILERTATLEREAEAQEVINLLLRQLDDVLLEAMNDNLEPHREL